MLNNDRNFYGMACSLLEQVLLGINISHLCPFEKLKYDGLVLGEIGNNI